MAKRTAITALTAICVFFTVNGAHAARDDAGGFVASIGYAAPGVEFLNDTVSYSIGYSWQDRKGATRLMATYAPFKSDIFRVVDFTYGVVDLEIDYDALTLTYDILKISRDEKTQEPAGPYYGLSAGYITAAPSVIATQVATGNSVTVEYDNESSFLLAPILGFYLTDSISVEGTYQYYLNGDDWDNTIYGRLVATF